MPTPAPAFLCRYQSDQTLAAATPVTVDVPVNGAKDWLILVSNTGDTNAVTAMTTASSPLGVRFEDPVTVASGIPIAAGHGLMARGLGEPATTVRITLTSTSGTTVTIEAGGW
jgi:hypothetical protein